MREKRKKNSNMKKTYILIITVFLTTIFVFSFFYYEFLTSIETNKKIRGSTVKQSKEVFRIGVVSRYSPSLIFEGYQPVIDYLNQKTDYHFELVPGKSYIDTINKLSSNDIQFAFLGDIVYLKERKRAKLIPIVCPLNREKKPFTFVVTITRKDSNINSLCDGKLKSIALPSENSFSSIWTIIMLKKCKKQPLIQHFKHHHTVVLEVLNGKYQAGTVRKQVANEFLNKGIKVIEKSVKIPSPPLVASPAVDKKVIEQVKKALLDFKPEQKRIIPEFENGFTEAGYGMYSKLEEYLKKEGYRLR